MPALRRGEDFRFTLWWFRSFPSIPTPGEEISTSVLRGLSHPNQTTRAGEAFPRHGIVPMSHSSSFHHPRVPQPERPVPGERS